MKVSKLKFTGLLRIDLQREFNCDMLLVESGGDNLAANYSRELADFIIYVIDVSGGDKIPRKGKIELEIDTIPPQKKAIAIQNSY